METMQSMTVENNVAVATDLQVRYNPLSKLDCFRAAIRSSKDGATLIPELPTEEEYVVTPLFTEEHKSLFEEYKELYFKDENIRFFNVAAYPESDVAKYLDASLDVLAIDPISTDGMAMWNAMFTPEKEVNIGDDANPILGYKYNYIDNLVFIGQIVLVTKNVYEILDVNPSYRSKALSYAQSLMAENEEQQQEEFIDEPTVDSESVSTTVPDM